MQRRPDGEGASGIYLELVAKPPCGGARGWASISLEVRRDNMHTCLSESSATSS
jgi:hypothetical protein